MNFVQELNGALFYTSLWIVQNNYVLQMYAHAATLAFM